MSVRIPSERTLQLLRRADEIISRCLAEQEELEENLDCIDEEPDSSQLDELLNRNMN